MMLRSRRSDGGPRRRRARPRECAAPARPAEGGPDMREHRYGCRVTWSSAQNGPTSSYESYSREYEVDISGKPRLRGSSDPSFKGDPALHNPEDLLLVALSTCHMLSYLALAAREKLLVKSYEDRAEGTMS